MKKKTFWMSFDLGIRGDYENLYRWLDTYKARECGNNLAVFKFQASDDYIEAITIDLKENVDFKDNDRIYLIYKDDSEDLIKGKFIIGKRKPSPWEGYAPGEVQLTEDF